MTDHEKANLVSTHSSPLGWAGGDCVTDTPSNGAGGNPALIPPEEAARALSVSPSTLKAARIGNLPRNPLSKLPFLKIGRAIRYRRADIEAWIEEQTVRPGEAAR